MLRFLFSTNNDSHLAADIAPGRCFAMCCEWARLATTAACTLIDSEQLFNEELINQGQILYEKYFQNEIKLMNELFSLSVICQNIILSHAPTKELAAKMLLDHLFSYPINSVIVIGIKVAKGSSGSGHALALRMSNIIHTGQECFELLDPNQGVWQTNDQQLIRKKLRTILLQEYENFLPGGKIKNANFTASFYAINWTPPPSTVLSEYKSEETEKSELKLEPALSNRMKHSLVVIQMLLSKQESENLGIPATRNKMAKLKYKEYLTIFQKFIDEAPNELQVKYIEMFRKHLIK